MPTIMTFYRDKDGLYCRFVCSDHARADKSSGDKQDGAIICAAVSALCGFMDNLVEAAAVDYYQLSAAGGASAKVMPERSVRWKGASPAMQASVEALRRTALALAAQCPDFVTVHECQYGGDEG